MICLQVRCIVVRSQRSKCALESRQLNWCTGSLAGSLSREARSSSRTQVIRKLELFDENRATLEVDPKVHGREGEVAAQARRWNARGALRYPLH